MKVHQLNTSNVSNSASLPAPHNRGAASIAGGSSGLTSGGIEPDDHVQVSTLSHRLNTADLQPASHASKVIELSSAVAAGRYHVDAQVLSSKLIQEHMRTAA